MVSKFCLVGTCIHILECDGYHSLKTRIINDGCWSTTTDNPIGYNVCNISLELGTNWLVTAVPNTNLLNDASFKFSLCPSTLR